MAKLFFYYSTMNAGKSTSLLQAAYNYAERGMQTILFSANRDVQEHGIVCSRIGISSPAHFFGPDTDFWELCAPQSPHCVLVDEAQFLTKSQVAQLVRIVDDCNIPVMCYGLRTDFQGELFPGSAALLAWADTLTEIKTICACGRKATMVVRVRRDGRIEREGQQVELGGNERYVSYCRKHFWESIRSGRCYDPAQENNHAADKVAVG